MYVGMIARAKHARLRRSVFGTMAGDEWLRHDGSPP